MPRGKRKGGRGNSLSTFHSPPQFMERGGGVEGSGGRRSFRREEEKGRGKGAPSSSTLNSPPLTRAEDQKSQSGKRRERGETRFGLLYSRISPRKKEKGRSRGA